MARSSFRYSMLTVRCRLSGMGDSAVAAALPQIAGRITATPLTPYAVWSALHAGG
jgi:hypothetical protein